MEGNTAPENGQPRDNLSWSREIKYTWNTTDPAFSGNLAQLSNL